jgi:phosphoserine phosphatase
MQAQSTHTDDPNPINSLLAPDLVTLIANPNNPVLSNGVAAKIGNFLGSRNIIWLGEYIACDIPLEDPAAFQPDELANIIKRELDNLPIDIVIHQSQTRRKKALIADMDSTMIEQECIDELAEMAGTLDQVAMITKRAMNGEIEFETSLRQRMALLRGLDVTIIDKVIEERITYTAGGKTLISTMKDNGTWCALVSGGFTAFTSRVAFELGFDEHHANILLENNGKLAGKVAEPILGRQAKVEELNKIAAAHNLRADDFIAVGDGANDLGMLKTAGTGVALHAKPAVAEQADIRVDHGDLTALLYIQGYKYSEFSN